MDLERVSKFLSDEHQKIEGWFFPLDQFAFFELFVAQDQLSVAGDVVEVGVFHGKSLVLLSLLKNDQEKIIGFDLFEDDHEERARDNMNVFGAADTLSLIKGWTSDISRNDLDHILKTPLRFLHIDAGHEYHEVLEQLYIFTPYLADRGFIAIDDYQDREFPGIEAAVLDFSEVDRPRRFTPFLASGNKLFLCYTPMADTWQKLLLNRPNFADKSRLTRVRDFNILVMNSKLPVPTETIIQQMNQLRFPNRGDDGLSLADKARNFSQLTFGSGKP